MGPPGSGKTTLIHKLLKSAPDGEPVALWSVGNAHDSAKLPSRRPRRMLLEAEDNAGLDRPAIGDFLAHAGYVGTTVAVVDGLAFAGHGPQTDGGPLREAAVVFVNRAQGLTCGERAELLRAVWAVNPRASVLVDPVDGLNLWRLLDAATPAPPATGSAQEDKKPIYGR